MLFFARRLWMSMQYYSFWFFLVLLTLINCDILVKLLLSREVNSAAWVQYLDKAVAINVALIPIRKVWIQLYFFQLWVNRRDFVMVTCLGESKFWIYIIVLRITLYHSWQWCWINRYKLWYPFFPDSLFHFFFFHFLFSSHIAFFLCVCVCVCVCCLSKFILFL